MFRKLKGGLPNPLHQGGIGVTPIVEKQKSKPICVDRINNLHHPSNNDLWISRNNSPQITPILKYKIPWCPNSSRIEKNLSSRNQGPIGWVRGFTKSQLLSKKNFTLKCRVWTYLWTSPGPHWTALFRTKKDRSKTWYLNSRQLYLVPGMRTHFRFIDKWHWIHMYIWTRKGYLNLG